MMTRPPAVVVSATVVTITVEVPPELKQDVVNIAYENQTSIKAVVIEALEEHVARHRGTVTARQASKLAAIEQLQREEAARLGIPLERLLARLAGPPSSE